MGFENLPPEMQVLITGFLPPEDQIRLSSVNQAARAGFFGTDSIANNRGGVLQAARAAFARLKNLYAANHMGATVQALGRSEGEIVAAIYGVRIAGESEKQPLIDELFRKLVRITGRPSGGLPQIMHNVGIGRPSQDAVIQATAKASNWSCAVQ
jgi:hypothetical protein